MSAKSVLQRVRFNAGTMSNDLLPTKRGRRKTSSPKFGQALTPDQLVATMTSVRASRPHRGDLVSYDHCCGIHGAARERSGIKRGTSAARRRYREEYHPGRAT